MTLDLMGEVGWDFGPVDVSKALKDANGQPVHVEIFSYGGDAFAGLGIYQQLRDYSGPVSTSVTGIAASAASVIAMAGESRRVPSNAALMIHPSWSFAMGGAEDLRKSANLLEKVDGALLSTYVEASGRPEDELRPYFEAESWLFGEEAFALGLATEVTDAEEALAMAGEIPEAVMSRLPERIRSQLSAAPPAPPAPAAPPAARATDPGSLPPSTAPKSAEPMTLPAAAAPDLEEAIKNARTEERERARVVGALAARANLSSDDRDALIDSDKTIEEIQAHILGEVLGGERLAMNQGLNQAGRGTIGMSAKEVQNYSVLRAIRHFADPTNAKLRDEAGLELEASAAAIENGRACQGAFRVPMDVAIAQIPGLGRVRNALESGGFTSGGALVDTELLMGSMIELLYNQLGLMRLNATMLTGLVGDIDIPREVSGPSHYWVSEGGAPPASAIETGQLSLAPKTVGAKTVITRRLMKQTSFGVELWVRRHLTERLAVGIDKDFVYSQGGSSTPRGLLQTNGINSVTLSGGTDKVIGGQTYNFGTFPQYVEAETLVSLANLDVDSMRHLMSPHTRGVLKTTLENENADFYIYRDGKVNEYECRVTNQMEVNHSILGDFSRAIVALWGGQDIGVNPYKYQDSGSVEISILQDCDFGVTYPEAFVFLS
ncbi:MAG: head maturation protease, ClpP-related [Cyanobacteria bacterium J06638_7]